MKKIEIKDRVSGSVLFAHDNNNTKSAVEEAVRSKIRLTCADLAGADLSWANLFEAYLVEADLGRARLDHVNLIRGDLTKANLTGVNAAGSCAFQANLERADLTGADLTGANLSMTCLAGANLSGAVLTGTNLTKADLAGANLSGAYLEGACLARAHLEGARLRRGEVLVGERPVFQISPFGRYGDCITVYSTDRGMRFDLWNRRQVMREEIERYLSRDSFYVKEYQSMLRLVEAHMELWVP